MNRMNNLQKLYTLKQQKHLQDIFTILRYKTKDIRFVLLENVKLVIKYRYVELNTRINIETNI